MPQQRLSCRWQKTIHSGGVKWRVIATTALPVCWVLVYALQCTNLSFIWPCEISNSFTSKWLWFYSSENYSCKGVKHCLLRELWAFSPSQLGHFGGWYLDSILICPLCISEVATMWSTTSGMKRTHCLSSRSRATHQSHHTKQQEMVPDMEGLVRG